VEERQVITYVNGRYVPRDQAVVSVDDRGLMFGDSVFDIGRTFGGSAFKLDAHLDRLRRSMRYVEMDGDGLIDEIREATEEVLRRNASAIEEVGDVYYEQIITRGSISPIGEDSNRNKPTIIVKLRPVPYAAFARYYEKGINLHSSLLTTSFAGPMDPRAKAANRLANTRAELKGERMRELTDRGHWTVMFNADGTIAETHGANLALVVDGRVVIPPVHQMLGGISLETLCELAESLGIAVQERTITIYDIINADETILTATSFSLLPVNGLDGIPLNDHRAVYSKLADAWKELVGIDFMQQALERTGAAPVGAGA
jgi:branched-chain amino acid aminotransferase